MRYKRYQSIKLSSVSIIIAVNILIFIATLIVPNLIILFGLKPANVLNSPWVIVTNLFIHGSLWHIMANMLTLYFFGEYLSRLIGERNFLILYFGGGILGNILYILLAPPYSIGIGASGAIFALGGALAVMRPKLRVIVFPIPAPIPLWLAVIGGFLLISFLPQVAWQAHLGGLIFGFIVGYFFKRRERYFFY